jgi:hypothetical protein
MADHAFDGWHRIPTDDAWKRVTLNHVASLGHSLWLYCNDCCREIVTEPLEFGRDKAIDPETPLLTINRRLKCSRCGSRKTHCRPKSNVRSGIRN